MIFAGLTQDDFDRFNDLSLDTSGITLEELERIGTALAVMQRGVNWWIGDAARAAQDRLKLGDNVSQIWPPWMSIGLCQRSEGVARAYEPEERNIAATWSQHMQVAGKPDRLKRVEEAVGKTTDESRKQTTEPDNVGSARKRWLLAIDCNYFLHRFFHSGAGVEAGTGVADWIGRTVNRLKEKGLTDVACCFDSQVNHRKELTKDWEHKYKDRPKKDDELPQQLTVLRDLLEQAGFTCVSHEGMEADDVMASFAAQFAGVVSLLTQDKDMRQCLSKTCNILLDVEWNEDEHTGDMLPTYKWLSAAKHTEETGLTPQQWIEYQCIAGDNVDGIKGAIGIGTKGATDLVKEHGTVGAVIQSAKDGTVGLSDKKTQALLDLEETLEVTRALVTLRTDLKVPENTRIA